MIRLEPFTAADFDELIAWSGDAAFLLQWAGPSFRHPLTEDQLALYMKGSGDPQTSDRLIYKVVLERTGRSVGHISLGSIDRDNRSGRVGKVLLGDASVRGQGIGELMMRAIVRIGFEELNLHRISLGVFDFNRSAIACYEKAGFRQEGVLRDARRFGDTFWNLVEMSILKPEWSGKASQ